MKNLVSIAVVLAALAGCAYVPVVPAPDVKYAPVVTAGVSVVYVWDPVRLRYYYVDKQNKKQYQPRGWKHPHGHKPKGHDYWDDRSYGDKP